MTGSIPKVVTGICATAGGRPPSGMSRWRQEGEEPGGEALEYGFSIETIEL